MPEYRVDPGGNEGVCLFLRVCDDVGEGGPSSEHGFGSYDLSKDYNAESGKEDVGVYLWWEDGGGEKVV